MQWWREMKGFENRARLNDDRSTKLWNRDKKRRETFGKWQ